jgi:RimJ/RimL family protein N-acetyltransferase
MNDAARITIGPLSDSDISDEYLETLNDRNYMKFSRNSAANHTKASQIEYIHSFTNSHNLLYGIKDLHSGELKGTLNCYIDFSAMTLDLGFLVFRKFQRMGYASEGLGMLLNYLKEQFPGMTAIIGTNKANTGMQKIAIKHGFHLEKSDSSETRENFKFVRFLPKLNYQSASRIPDLILNAKTIGIAAHDAGGAEQIAWLVKNLPHKVLSYLGGPAKKIFESSGLPIDRTEQLGEILRCDIVITGSGWMSELEISVINEAKLRGIPCITILDHWVNYLERFGSSSHPQIISVTNVFALEIAQEKFPNTLIFLLPDFQIENYRAKFHSMVHDRESVLILLEPASSLNDFFSINDHVLEDLMASAISIKQSRLLESIVVRLHPSQIEEKSCMNELKKFSEYVEISSNDTLLDDLANSAVVIGINSYAMYISTMCGIDTYSYFAGVRDHWTNRFPQIYSLSSHL